MNDASTMVCKNPKCAKLFNKNPERKLIFCWIHVAQVLNGTPVKPAFFFPDFLGELHSLLPIMEIYILGYDGINKKCSQKRKHMMKVTSSAILSCKSVLMFSSL